MRMRPGPRRLGPSSLSTPTASAHTNASATVVDSMHRFKRGICRGAKKGPAQKKGPLFPEGPLNERKVNERLFFGLLLRLLLRRLFGGGVALRLLLARSLLGGS